MRVRVRLDSKFAKSRIDFGPGPDFSLRSMSVLARVIQSAATCAFRSRG